MRQRGGTPSSSPLSSSSTAPPTSATTTRTTTTPTAAHATAVATAASSASMAFVSRVSRIVDEAAPSVKTVGMTCVAFLICNMDKVNMSIAVVPMARDLGWSPTISGLVQSSFYYGYSIAQLPSGLLAKRFSGQKLLPLGVLLWSAATFAIPFAAHFGSNAAAATADAVVGTADIGNPLLPLFLCRFLVGLGEGTSPSSAVNIIATSVPVEARARATTLVFGSLNVGSVVGLLLAPTLIENLGWESVFTLFGSIGIVWCGIWWKLSSDGLLAPVETERSVDSGSTAIAAPGAASNNAGLPWRRFIDCVPLRALTYTHFCNNWSGFVMLSWIPTYLSQVFRFDLSHAAYISILPPLASALFGTLAGQLADFLIANTGMSTTTVRKSVQLVAFIAPALCLVKIMAMTADAGGDVGATDQTDIIVLLTLALGLGAFSLAGLFCNHQDLSKKYASVLLGLTNTAGASPGIIGVAFTGYMLGTIQCT